MYFCFFVPNWISICGTINMGCRRTLLSHAEGLELSGWAADFVYQLGKSNRWHFGASVAIDDVHHGIDNQTMINSENHWCMSTKVRVVSDPLDRKPGVDLYFRHCSLCFEAQIRSTCFDKCETVVSWGWGPNLDCVFRPQDLLIKP